jgi:hypothetical protein
MGDVAPKLFWMRESLEKDFFTADKDGYTKFLGIANTAASIGVGQITSPIDLMNLLDVSIWKDLNQKIGAYAKSYVAENVSSTLQDTALDNAVDGLLSKAFLAGHGHVPKNKVTDQDVTKGWIELSKQSVLFLVSIPTGAAPLLAGLLLIFPFLKVLATIDMARKHDRYQQLIDSMLLKYQAILDRANLKIQERLEKERATAQQGLDYNDDQHTKQEEKIVFEGVYKGKIIQLNSLSMSKIRSVVEERLNNKSVHDKLIVLLDSNMQDRLKYRLNPPKLTFPELGKIYARFESSRTSLANDDKKKFAKEVSDDALAKAVALVLQHKSEVADVDLLVPLRGLGEASTVDDLEYGDLLEEQAIPNVPIFDPKKPWPTKPLPTNT